jgi:hypothetical protein
VDDHCSPWHVFYSIEWCNITPSIIHRMEPVPSFRQYLYSSLFLIFIGWGGLILMIFVFNEPPLVWARWGFFTLWFIALTGTALPVMYLLNQRFASEPPAEAQVIVRQALWVGVFGATLAWLQLGHLVTLWVWMGLAGGLIAIEYLIRLRERSHWRPPTTDADLSEIEIDEQSSDTPLS